MGARLTDDDKNAVHHYWRYGAHLNGVCEEMLTDTLEEEMYQYQRIRERQYSPNEESRMLAQVVINALAGQPTFNLPEGLLNELSRMCLGDALADVYELPRDKKWHKAAVAYKLANKLGTFAHYHVPGAEQLSAKYNYKNLRQSLMDNLPADPEKRAFRNIA